MPWRPLSVTQATGSVIKDAVFGAALMVIGLIVLSIVLS
jgi:hypothetical protein